MIKFDAIAGDDVLVFPENNAQFLAMFAGRRQTKVVFCQNPFLVHQGLAGHLSYAEFGVACILGSGAAAVGVLAVGVEGSGCIHGAVAPLNPALSPAGRGSKSSG